MPKKEDEHLQEVRFVILVPVAYRLGNFGYDV